VDAGDMSVGRNVILDIVHQRSKPKQTINLAIACAILRADTFGSLSNRLLAKLRWEEPGCR